MRIIKKLLNLHQKKEKSAGGVFDFLLTKRIFAGEMRGKHKNIFSLKWAF